MVSRSRIGSAARSGIAGETICGLWRQDNMLAALRGKRVPSGSRGWKIGRVNTTIVYIWSRKRWG